MDITLNLVTFAVIIIAAIGVGAFSHKWLAREVQNTIQGKK